MFLKISQNSQKNTCVRFSFLKSCRPEACNFIKKETLAQVFFMNFAKFLRTPFLQNTSGGLFLILNVWQSPKQMSALQLNSYGLREKCSYSQFFWSVFFRIRTEYGEKYGHFHAVTVFR